MSNNPVEGFDPLRDQATQKSARVQGDARRKAVRRVGSILLLPILTVVGMYAVGGTGEFSEWKAVKKSLKDFGDGRLSQEKSGKLVRLMNGIENVRGNGSALAGVYTVYALQMLSDGNKKNAGYALEILKKEYASQVLFSELWDRNSLTEACKECASKSRTTKCVRCKGTGRLVSSGSKLKNSRKVDHPLGSTRKKCAVCNGTGRISSNLTTCKLCGGSGKVFAQDKVSQNLEKALRRANVLVSLKCVQCALSLRPLFKAGVSEE